MSDKPNEALKALEIDEQGNIVTRPVLGWITVPVAGMSVLLRLNYAETPEELGMGGRHLQVILTPQQALELAEILTIQGQHIFRVPAPPGTPS